MGMPGLLDAPRSQRGGCIWAIIVVPSPIRQLSCILFARAPRGNNSSRSTEPNWLGQRLIRTNEAEPSCQSPSELAEAAYFVMPLLTLLFLLSENSRRKQTRRAVFSVQQETEEGFLFFFQNLSDPQVLSGFSQLQPGRGNSCRAGKHLIKHSGIDLTRLCYHRSATISICSWTVRLHHIFWQSLDMRWPNCFSINSATVWFLLCRNQIIKKKESGEKRNQCSLHVLSRQIVD